MKVNVIVAAGGKSQRYGVKNKLFEPLGSSCVLVEAIKPFLQTECVSRVVVGMESTFTDELLSALDLAGLGDERRIVLSIGGDSRTQTVKNALSAVEDDADFVLVHDGARPYVSAELIGKVIDAAKSVGAAVALAPCVDSLVKISDAITPVDRSEYRRVQTPFCARTDLLKKAYQNAKSDFYDDISVYKTLDCAQIAIVEGEERNSKITYDGDIVRSPLFGCGYDVHKLHEGRGIRLFGVDVDCPFALDAHSDGDVPVHAVMDALLTAIGDRDIGHLFPVDDCRYDGADSMQLLSTVMRRVAERGYKVSNASVTVVLERPMLQPYIGKMKASLAAALGVQPHAVGIAATTNEGLDFIGRGEGIAAFATVSLV